MYSIKNLILFRNSSLVVTILCLIAGGLNALSFAPVNRGWLQCLSMGIFIFCAFVKAHQKSVQHAAKCGFLFGFSCFLTGAYWLYISMHQYGKMSVLLSLISLVLFCCLCALFPLVASAISSGLFKASIQGISTCPLHLHKRNILAFSGIWSLTEILRGQLFPLLTQGYAHIDSPLSNLAPWIGSYGISLLATLSASGVALLMQNIFEAKKQNLSSPAKILTYFLPSIGIICTPFILGIVTQPINKVLFLSSKEEILPSIKIRLIQENIDQELKFAHDRIGKTMRQYVEAIGKEPADLTVLPETAWIVPWDNAPAFITEEIKNFLTKNGGLIAVGMPQIRFTKDVEYIRNINDLSITNSIGVIDSSGTIIYAYDKAHLLPFGEFKPTALGWFVELMDIPLGNLSPGSKNQDLLSIGQQKIAFNICYEDFFGEELASAVQNGATILINASNIAWFGNTIILQQHLNIARMRALEFAKPMLRATNTGITAAIDRKGHVIAQAKVFSKESISIRVSGTSTLTPFVRAPRVIPFSLCLLCIVLGSFGSISSKKTSLTKVTSEKLLH